MGKIVNNLFVTQFNGYEIYHHENFNVVNIKLGDIDFFVEYEKLLIRTPYIKFMHHLFDVDEVIDGIKNISHPLFKLAKELQPEHGQLYCGVSTFVFYALTPYSTFLRANRMPMNAIEFWYNIIYLTLKWEKENNFVIHKGSLYGYIGEAYMHILDYETGFTFLNRAVKEDINIQEYIIEYPQNAPSYKIINLKTDQNHFMAGYVNMIREEIRNMISLFAVYFAEYSDFNLSKFDSMFIDNKYYDTKKIEDFKSSFLYSFWSILLYVKKIDPEIIPSTFDNINSLNKLLSLCVTTETLFNGFIKKSQYVTNKKFQKKMYIYLGGNPHRFNDIFNLVDHLPSNRFPEYIVDLLNNSTAEFKNIKVSPLDKTIMLFIMLRNFSAHNIESIDAIGKNFYELYKQFIYLNFALIIQSYKKGDSLLKT